ncbi:trehalose-phosphatase [Psychromicrobium lacuslunae]|uniref:Trehalose 6-phosphate phosphatase n=1 Tax=Psychromicrobium lacuslunae TaxID=1618207 RepID=A0A0D4C2N6_9MICC|nr:trehalose-phosphatase [Psychromicrobium lacuslunae]AJT42616.1 haloacid dehalogenase [Psychromicrobium lacuslunae]
MLSAALRSAVEEIAGTEQLLVAMDFDGTMSPLVPRAEDARALPENAAAFAALTELPRTSTALISGRALASLRMAAQPPQRTLLVGSHGAERWFGPAEPALELNAEQTKLLAAVSQIFDRVAGQYPGVTVEHKPAGVVLHTRQADERSAERAVALAEQALQTLPLAPHRGKQVLEASVLQVDKGQGLELLRERSSATALLFAGDDTTDENGFRALRAGDVGVKVGEGDTAAEFRIDSVAQTAELLQLLLAHRRNVLR